MSKIGDELRDYCKKVLCYTHYYDKFWYFADRIDREMVELPRDRDGVPINLGDEVCLNGKNGRVTCIEYRINDESYVTFWANRECIVCTKTELAELTHTRPDSWKRIADELEAWCDDSDVDGDACDVPRGIADRIRRLAKESGHE